MMDKKKEHTLLSKIFTILWLIVAFWVLASGVYHLFIGEIYLGVLWIGVGIIVLGSAYYIDPYMGMSDLEKIEMIKTEKLKMLEEWIEEAKTKRNGGVDHGF